ncbi:hypothetical protein D1610_14420 [Sphingomonas gilva]|uniref:Uncharacterized protein n=1 Tax=Sphingomonas gilva TaxID=2305907 RepID=A0A396RK40_9SPHN|nr:YdbH domain-containing protein [Sphingomonas gilva]RHW16587.1 hypothetical protein D1610_14420 [Sphingomonas gilva]
MDDPGPEVDSPPRRRWRMRVALVAGGVAAVGLLGVWTQRKPIVEGYVNRELTARGVEARYEIADLGFNRQRLTDVVIGDPLNPDLTARVIDLNISVGFSGAELHGFHAEGLRVRGRLVDGRLSLGEIDKLLPPPSGKPFTLPDIAAGFTDARMRLETPAGVIGLKLDGAGPLTDGFSGRLAAVSEQLAAGGCTLASPTAWVRVSVVERQPHIAGPVRFDAADCGEARAQDGTIDVDLALEESLDRWRGKAEIAVARVASGENWLGGVSGEIDFNGGTPRTDGNLRLAVRDFLLAGNRGQGLEAAGGYMLGQTGRRFDGTVAVRRARIAPAMIASLDGARGAADGTPAGPLLDRLAQAARRASGEVRARAALAIEQHDGRGWAALSGLDARSGSGARLTLSDGDGLRFAWPGGRPEVDGLATLSGGGFPSATVRIAQAGPGGAITGTALVSPLTGEGARLALRPVDFTVAPGGGTRFSTRIELSGPLGDGRVDGLTLPLSGTWDGAGALALNPDCGAMAFQRLAISGLVLDPATLRLCPASGAMLRIADGRVTGGARIAAPRLSGRLGSTPVTLAAAGSDVSLAQGGFAIDGLAARLGAEGRVTRLDFGRLEGRIEGDAVSGAFSGGGGQIANVPLILSDAAGRWRLLDGVLDVTGATGVSDEQTPPRFQPMTVPDVALKLADNVITATGTITEPTTSRRVGDVDIRHDLSAGEGRALLAVPGITFDEGLQPEMLTRLTLGVAANVRGTVTGEGRIDWDQRGVTSTGVFRTAGADLAAAFGPVKGLTTEIRFTDLLGLVSAPGQTATVAEVNPGIAVNDGVIRYRLLADQKVQVEGGRWPFAGGELILEPTVLDFGEQAERRLTFTVDGLDAARFIQQLEFENVAATGIFDGKLPMVFDANGGRIDDGRLTVRPGGGTLAYVGEVSNADLGTWGKLAFDALKSIRYDRLTIDLDGAIDGEIVTQIRFNGVNQGTTEGQAGYFKELIGLPFIFNITIRAPFRGLLSTARSFTDPSELIRSQLPEIDSPDISSPKPNVQPQESEELP